MKRIFTLTAVALITASNAAFAMAPSAADTTTIQRYAPQADVPMLSDGQVHDLLAIIQSNDNETDKRIRAALVINRGGTVLR